MADEFDIPSGDAAGSKARKKQLDDLRKSAVDAQAEIKTLAQEFKELEKSAKEIGVKQYVTSAEVGKVSKLQDAMSKMTVDTLKSASARKSFMNDIVKAEQEEAALMQKRKAIGLEISKLEQDAARKEQEARNIIKEATKEYQEALEKGNKKAITSAEQKLKAAEAQAKYAQLDIADSKTAISNLKGQAHLVDERVKHQKESIEKAKEFHKEIDKINKAGGKTLQAFAKLGETLSSTLPILGGAFNTLFGSLGKAAEMYQTAAAQGTSKLGAGLKAATGMVKLLSVAMATGFIKLLFDGAKLASEIGVEVRKGLGGGMIDAGKSIAAVGQAAGALSIPIQQAAAFVGQMNDALGTSAGFSGKILTTFGTLTTKMGVSAEAAANLYGMAAKSNQEFGEMVELIGGTTEKLNASNKAAIAPKAVFEEMGKLSQEILFNNSKNPNALIKAAYGARLMGMELNRVAEAAESTLDFEGSLQKEMEAELILGKQLNLDRYRAAAATGDTVTAQKELSKAIAENKDKLKGNVQAQKLFAEAYGVSKEEVAKAVNMTEKQQKIAKQDAARKEANDKAAKMRAEDLGKAQLKVYQTVAKLSDRIQAFQDAMALGAKAFFDDLKAAFDPKNIGASIGRIKDLIVKTFRDAFKGANKGILANGGILGKLLGAGAIAGGTITLGIKGLSALGGMFSKMRGTRMMPMWVKNVGDKAAGMLGGLFGRKKPPPLPGAAKTTGMFAGVLGKFSKVGDKFGKVGDTLKDKLLGKKIGGQFIKGGGRAAAGARAGFFGKGGLGAGAAGLGAGIKQRLGDSVGGLKDKLKGGVGGLFGGKKKGDKTQEAAASGGGDGKSVMPPGVDDKSGGILKGFAMGLKAFGSGAAQILIGAAVLGGVIITLAAAIGIGGLILASMMPKIVKGMKPIEEIDAAKMTKGGLSLVAVGAGFAALGVGMAAMAVGGLFGAIGGLFGGGGGLDEETMSKIEDFEKYNLDDNKIKKNAAAVVAYSKGMAALGAAGIASAIGSLGSMFSSLFDAAVGKSQLDKVKEFGSIELPVEAIKNNANALVAYMKGMAALGVAGVASALGSLGSMFSSLFDSMAGKSQLDKVKEFGSVILPTEAIKNNAEASVEYAKAMLALAASGGAGMLGSLGNLGSTLLDGINGFFGGEDPLTKNIRKMKEFGKIQLDAGPIKANAEAVAAYATAMAALAKAQGAGALGSLAEVGSAVFDGIKSFFGGGDSGNDTIPVDKMIEFGKLPLAQHADAIKANAETISKFGTAMSSMEDFDDYADDMEDGIDDAISAAKKLSKMKEIDLAGVASLKRAVTKYLKPLADIDLDGLPGNARAAQRFARAMATGTIQARLEIDTFFKTEIDVLKKEIVDTSNNEVTELRNMMVANDDMHKKELKELKAQSMLLYKYIAQPQNTTIRLDTFDVGMALRNGL